MVASLIQFKCTKYFRDDLTPVFEDAQCFNSISKHNEHYLFISLTALSRALYDTALAESILKCMFFLCQPNKKALIKVITENNMCETLLTLLSTLARISNQGNQVVGGARQRITEALQGLHAAEKTVENNEQLLVSEITKLSLFKTLLFC